MSIEQEAVNKEINCEADTAHGIVYCYLNFAVKITFVSTVVTACANANGTVRYVTIPD
jgi:hypothetical protein